MIKGIGKQVVVFTDPTSRIYEQAIFILRQDAPEAPPDADMLEEAERIINAHLIALPRARGYRRLWLRVLIISIAVSLLVGASILLFMLKL